MSDETPPAATPSGAGTLLEALQQRIDQVQEQLVTHTNMGAALVEHAASLDEYAAALREELAKIVPVDPPDPPPPPPPPSELPWWLAKGGPSLSGRPFRSGSFAVMGSALKTWANYMGHPPEIAGGNITGYGSGKWLADTWEKVAVQQADIANHPQTRDCVLGLDPLSKRTWLVLMFTTFPMGGTLDELIASAKGERASYHRRLGQNLRKELLKAGRDPELTIARPDWEMNQDTAFRVKAPGRVQNFLLAGGSLQMYQDHIRAFATAFWDGFGYQMPLAFSPAYQDGAGVPHVPYEKWLEAEVYALCCGSYHPNAERTATQNLAWQMVFSEHNGCYTPAVVINAARKANLPVAFLEHSCPPDASACRPNLRWAAFAYIQFGMLVERNPDLIAFACSLGSGMISEAKQKSLGEPIASQWAEMVRQHRKYFGKKV